MQRRRFGRQTYAVVGAAGLLALVATVTFASYRQDDGISSSALSCPLEPLTLPLFAATPAAEVGTPVPADVQDATEQPSAEVREEIAESVDVIIACANTGEPRFAYAVFSDGYLAALFTGDDAAYQPAFERYLTRPATPPALPLELQDLRSVRLMPDGRAVVQLVIDGGGPTLTDTLVLVKEGDGWLVDEVLALSPPVSSASGAS